MALLFRLGTGQSGAMQTIVGFFGTCQSALTDLVGLPARHLTAFMDGVDEVWLSESFRDQPAGIDQAH